MKQAFFLLLSFFLSVYINLSASDIQVLCWKPRIFKISGFLSEEECEYLIEKAAPHLARSLVVDIGTSALEQSSGRTSSSMFFPVHHDDPIIQAIEERIALITLIPIAHGEGLQVVKYAVGEQYKPHYDYFDPRHPGSIAHLRRGGQRIASFLMYLNTPEEGGETYFPKLELAVSPVKGDALLFYDCTVDGKIDPLTYHGGAPVIKGEKWLATKWLRQFHFE